MKVIAVLVGIAFGWMFGAFLAFLIAGPNFGQLPILTVPIGLSARANSPDINPATPFPNPEGVVPTVAYGGSNINGAGPYTDYNPQLCVVQQPDVDEGPPQREVRL